MTDYNQELCNQRHDNIEHGMTDMKEIMLELKHGQQTIHKKLFVDNGTESIQSRINRMDNWIKGVCASVVLLVLPVLFLIIKMVIDMIQPKT